MLVNIFDNLEIETSGGCNRACPMCLRQTYPNRMHETHAGRMAGVPMPGSMFRRIVDESVALGFTGRVCLSHYNEPTLDGRLADFARYVQGKPEIVGNLTACTNGDALTKEMAGALDGVLDELAVTLYMDRSEARVREATLRQWFTDTSLRFIGNDHGITHYSPDAEGLAHGVAKHGGEPRTRYNESLFVAHDGTVLHCCDDYVGHFGLGTLAEQSVGDVWNGATHAALVERLSRPDGKRGHPYCAICPRATS